jgi:hypothetical protein
VGEYVVQDGSPTSDGKALGQPIFGLLQREAGGTGTEKATPHSSPPFCGPCAVWPYLSGCLRAGYFPARFVRSPALALL